MHDSDKLVAVQSDCWELIMIELDGTDPGTSSYRNMSVFRVFCGLQAFRQPEASIKFTYLGILLQLQQSPGHLKDANALNKLTS